MDRISELEKQLEQEREKVKGLHEITKVICTHCCEPMEIPSKAVLQTQLTQLQALVRAAAVQIEQVEGELHTALNGARHDPSWIRPIQLSRNERQELYLSCERQLKAIRATLDATTPAAKGGDGE